MRGFLQFGLEHLQYPVEVFQDFVVPYPDHAIAERVQLRVTLPVSRIIGMLTAIDLDDEAPFAADEIDVKWTDRFLADEFEAAE